MVLLVGRSRVVVLAVRRKRDVVLAVRRRKLGAALRGIFHPCLIQVDNLMGSFM